MYQDGSIMWSKPFWCRTLFTIYYSMEFFSYSIFFQSKCTYNIHTYISNVQIRLQKGSNSIVTSHNIVLSSTFDQ